MITSMKSRKTGSGRKPKFAESMATVLYLRVPEELIAALDRLARRESAARPGLPVSRLDMARSLLIRAAAAEEM